MPNLLETIQQNRQNLASQQQGVGDQTQQLATLLKAKSGTAPTTSDTSISNLGEQSAVAGTNSKLGQLGTQAQVQTQAENTQRAGIQQQAQQQQSDIAQSRKLDTMQSRIQTQSLLQTLGQQRGQLQDDRSQAALEQVAFNLSMQDKQYTDSLQRIGAVRRLDDANNFRTEMEQITFGDQLSLLKQKLGDADVLQASDRDFQKVLSDMSIQDALKTAAIEMKAATTSQDVDNAINRGVAQKAATAANTQAIYGGLGETVTGGITGYDALQKAQERKAAADAAKKPADDSADEEDLEDYG